MRILVTGANGQLGQELMRQRVEGVELVGAGRAELDVTVQEQVRAVFRDARPDAVIHAAAYTAVDLAETHPDEAFLVNAMGARNVAVAAEEIGARVCYVSTDYVFDGTGETPYGEYDNPNPQSVYGKTKHAGEILVQTLSSRWFIVRTSWVFGKYGANFVKTMLAKAREVPSLRVVCDQVGSPTYTKDLAALLLQLVATDRYGIYHASNTGSCSWYEFARAIFEEAGIATSVEPCATEEYPRPAPRPRYSVLGHTALRVNGFPLLRPWREALRAFLREDGLREAGE
ncbi:MAG: dTDP-4-dehydrorhamnose reductase [Alicyclobacillus sp.]|nr:dTDP-4-dehydrorhamnose reductase [Alicyclobacillus sp.]